ncbi:10137_t:CDS:1 [Ambispora gerdemannii]|uniref:10137_t:CDS:1 n=1 Tax=Ambispora gerdemannii TaxID=144530 RepID=A0A9N8YPB6_9GLOM|nr:10137_t:CDS:1 [Ambispora gerdemannii]
MNNLIIPPSISKCPVDGNHNVDDKFKLFHEISNNKSSQKPPCDHCDVSRERVKTLNESVGRVEALMNALAKTTTGAESLNNYTAVYYSEDKPDEEEMNKNISNENIGIINNQDLSKCSFEDLKNLASLAYSIFFPIASNSFPSVSSPSVK